jgi:hypothetical protein
MSKFNVTFKNILLIKHDSKCATAGRVTLQATTPKGAKYFVDVSSFDIAKRIIQKVLIDQKGASFKKSWTAESKFVGGVA